MTDLPPELDDPSEVLGLCPACGVVVDYRNGGCAGCHERALERETDFYEAEAAARGSL